VSGDIPNKWEWTSLSECCEILDNERIPINSKERQERISNKKETELYPYYGATGQVGWIDDYLFDDEIILLGEDGAPFLDAMKNKAYLVKGKSWVNNHAHVLKALSGLTSNKFICNYLNFFEYNGYVTGTTRYKLNQSRMKEIPVLIPPLTEQQRIVAKIEELFTKLDAGIEALKKSKEQLKRYRQSVLKAAVEGRLTEEWREQHLPASPCSAQASKGKLEPADKLLERILIERREKWEAEQLSKYKSNGKKPPKNWQDKYKEPTPPDTTNLPELPIMWSWVY